MPYVQRDADGRLLLMRRDPAPDAAEFLPDEHPEVQAFVARPADDGFSRLDADFVRVLEDLIDALISRHVLTITDLPAEAQVKLFARKSFRERSGRNALRLFGDDPQAGIVQDTGLREP